MGVLFWASLALGVLRFLAWGAQQLWGRNARLEARIAWLEARQAIARAERERLKNVYKGIDQAPKPADPLKDFDDAYNRRDDP
jgi:hypothetical protein